MSLHRHRFRTWWNRDDSRGRNLICGVLFAAGIFVGWFLLFWGLSMMTNAR